MDAENVLPEGGTPLPLPEDIDSHVDQETHDTQDTIPTEALGTDASGETGQMRDDLWDCSHQSADEMPTDEPQPELGDTFGPGHENPSEFMSQTPHELSSKEGELNDADKALLDSMVHQAMLSASLDDGLSLPWETGVMASIFSDAPLAPMPQLPKVAHTLDHTETDPNSPLGQVGSRAKKPRIEAPATRLYERAISFKNTLTDPELDQMKWNRALEKLYAVMVSGPNSRQEGINFAEGDMERNLHQIRLLCGARSPNTISKRANSLLQFCTWHKGYYYRKYPIPFEQGAVADFVWERHQDGASYSNLVSFVEAVNFGTYVLGLPVMNPDVPVVSAFVKGVLDKQALTRPKRRQARPLTVTEVVVLESMVKDAAADEYDSYAAGAFLFALFGRCRWSDLRHVSQFLLDVNQVDGKTIGYIEFSTFSHKTASQVARHGLPLPLVAPLWGLTHPCWALEWNKLAKTIGIVFDETFKGPILPAPDKAGVWSRRSVSASEATKWLCELLKQHGSSLEEVSSHSLKCTVLSWLAKAGTEPHHRSVLGHHSTQKGSLETYSRDMLAAPLRALEDVLRRIRVGALHPDLTRSGHIREPTMPDCADKADEQSEAANSSSQDESSTSSSSSDSDSDSELAHQLEAVGGGDPHVQRAAWGFGTMYQHVLSKIVHLQQDGDAKTFMCGLHATKDHVRVESTQFLESRKCKRCTRVTDSA